MELRITINDAAAQRALDALCARFGYDAASGLTQAQFVRQLIKQWLTTEVLAHEQGEAAAAARRAVAAVEL
jgi:hypothetical protein